MKILSPPNHSAINVYNDCVSTFSDSSLRNIFYKKSDLMSVLDKLYQKRAIADNLHSFKALKRGEDEQIVLKSLNKKLLMRLYSNMVSSSVNHPARKFYDQVRNSAIICPYCQFGHVSTLDHFLPKAYYPYFSVLPKNLIPSCSDCNIKKNSKPLVATESIPHPYYADLEIENEQWLYAKINNTDPLSVTYFVSPPSSWSLKKQKQIHNFFSSFELKKRFATQASVELSDFIDSASIINKSNQSILSLIQYNLKKIKKLLESCIVSSSF